LRNRSNGPNVVVPLFIGFMGLASFANVASSPGFAAIRSIDIVRLLASGMCFGAAIASIAILWLGGPAK
jgi:hypothetical protein